MRNTLSTLKKNVIDADRAYKAKLAQQVHKNNLFLQWCVCVCMCMCACMRVCVCVCVCVCV